VRNVTVEIIIVVGVLATSILSGVIGMAGGMILMAILVSTVTVASAMMIHGAVQATSNGSRAFFLRQHIQWQLLPAYLAGASTALGIFAALALVPDADLVLIAVGAFPFLARLTPHLRGLDVTRPRTTFSCGVVVTAAQLFAGASGPLLDVFYLNSKLNRFQVIASKALTQTLGHLLKLLYYGLIIGVTDDVAASFYLLAMAVAVAGTRTGTTLLKRLPEARFRRASGYLILAIAAACVVKGVLGLLAP
jgi:uncharacterized membrane protein YfcA